MVEAAGIEPLQPGNSNPKMTHDFGFYGMKTSELPRGYLSPGVLPSLGDILETLWQHAELSEVPHTVGRRTPS